MTSGGGVKSHITKYHMGGVEPHITEGFVIIFAFCAAGENGDFQVYIPHKPVILCQISVPKFACGAAVTSKKFSCGAGKHTEVKAYRFVFADMLLQIMLLQVIFTGNFFTDRFFTDKFYKRHFFR